MAVLYRAIWDDLGKRADLFTDLRATFEQWAKSVASRDAVDINVPQSGTSYSGPFEVDATEASNANAALLRFRLRQEKDHQHWTTSIVAMVPASDDPAWVWVDVEWVDDELFGRPPVLSAPRLVRVLLDNRGGMCGSLAITAKPKLIQPRIVDRFFADLAEPNRAAPVLVLTRAPDETENQVQARGMKAAERLAGIAAVWLLPDDSVDAWRNALGEELHVWGGASRIYLPGLTASEPSPWRHRYLPYHRLDRRPDGAARWAARFLAPQAAARRPPPLYRTIGRDLLREATDLDWLQESMRLEDELESAQQRIEELERGNLLQHDELSEALARADRAERRVRYLERRLRELDAEYVSAYGEEQDSDEITVQTCREVVDLVRDRLSDTVVLPDTAVEDVDDLSDSHYAAKWASDAWTAFRALDQYVRDGADGGFGTWARNGGYTMAKVAMRESETVESNARSREARTFPVDTRIDPSGAIVMFAHLKPGGPATDAPRIHFYDDTKGATGKIHIGYFGPHLPLPGR